MRFSIKDILKTVLISFGWLLAIFIIVSIMFIVFGKVDEPNAVILLVSIGFIPTCITTMLTINKHLLRKNSLNWEAFGFIPLKKRQIAHLLWQVPFFCLLIYLTEITFLISVIGNSQDLPSKQSSSLILEFTPFIFIVVFLSYAIFTPLLEEIIFRGGILQSIEHKFNAPVAMVASSLLFMIAHGITLLMPALFVMGLSLAYLYQKYKSIYAPIILHMFINGINVIAVNIIL